MKPSLGLSIPPRHDPLKPSFQFYLLPPPNWPSKESMDLLLPLDCPSKESMALLLLLDWPSKESMALLLPPDWPSKESMAESIDAYLRSLYR